MKIEQLIKNIHDKIIEMKSLFKAGVISKHSFDFTVLCAEQALKSNDCKRMERSLRILCIECGANPDIDWKLKF